MNEITQGSLLYLLITNSLEAFSSLLPYIPYFPWQENDSHLFLLCVEKIRKKRKIHIGCDLSSFSVSDVFVYSQAVHQKANNKQTNKQPTEEYQAYASTKRVV